MSGQHILDVQLPEEKATGAPGGDFQHIATDANMFGGFGAKALQTFGSGLENLGSGLSKAGDAGLDIATHQQEMQNEVHASEVNTWLADRITDRHAQFATLEGRTALDQLPKYKQDLDDLYKQSMDQASSPSEKVMLAKSGRYLTNQYYGYATRYATGQARAWADKTATDRAATYGDQALIASQNGDRNGMEVALHTSDDETRKLFERKGYDDEAINAEVSKNRGKNLSRIIKETSVDDPDGAVKMFFKYAPQMDTANVAATATYLKPIKAQQVGRQIGDEALGQPGTPAGLNDEIGRAASIAGLDPALLRGVVRIESGGNPAAAKGSYKGLGQLSDDQFQKYGGGDIFNARDNLRATARKLADEAGEFQQTYGRLPTAAEMYLTHQQGAGGFAAHIANPDRPAWQNMLSTKEGQQKGEGWAKAAIWGNVPDQDKARFGSVDNITSGQFMRMWERKVDAATGQALPDKTEAFSRARDILSSINASPATEAATLTYLGRRYAHEESETALETQKVEGLVKSDLSSMLATGRGVDDLNPYRVQRALGATAAQKWSDDRNDALATWTATHDLPSLTNAQIEDRLTSIAPKSGDADFARKQAIYEKAGEAATALRKQRDIDPAGSVALDPTVQAAAVQAHQPGTVTLGPLVDARLAAQTRAGIPKENQSPITQAEAVTLTRPLRTMLPGQEREVLTSMAKNFQTLFGDNADTAFEYALRVHKVEAEVAQVAVRLMKKLNLGQVPTQEETRAADATTEVAKADAAVNAGSNAAYTVPGFGMGPDQQAVDAGAAARRAGVNLPARAIIDLRLNPKLAVDFDKKYGAGTAAKILENYPVR
jgi:soluble lytic murein transglycosylase-like protein